jgi:IS5 family transposase
LDATFLDREAASSHYVPRFDRHVRTLEVTALVDTASRAILDLHVSVHWPHDTQVGSWAALRNTNDRESLSDDKGYDDQSMRESLSAQGVSDR